MAKFLFCFFVALFFVFPCRSFEDSFSFAEMESGTFEQNGETLPYKVFIPSEVKVRPGLLMVLHGCTQNAKDMAVGGKFNAQAEIDGFIVVYPEQTAENNPMKCWNWFEKENQERGESGELALISGLTKKMIEEKGINPKKVFVLGFSAGAAMTSNLLACYSDLFNGGVIHSGLEYAAAESVSEAQRVMRTGPRTSLDLLARRASNCSPRRNEVVPTVVVHGAEDTTVNVINGRRTSDLFQKINVIISKRTGHPGNLTQTTSELTDTPLSATLKEVFVDDHPIVKEVIVNHMAHAYSGGASGPYMEPEGPDITSMIVKLFFKKSINEE